MDFACYGDSQENAEFYGEKIGRFCDFVVAVYLTAQDERAELHRRREQVRRLRQKLKRKRGSVCKSRR